MWLQMDVLATGLCMFVLCFMLDLPGSVLADGTDQPYGDGAISLALCYSRCYKQYGVLPDHFDAGGYYEMAEEFCPNKACKNCKVPCNEQYTSYEDCVYLCVISQGQLTKILTSLRETSSSLIVVQRKPTLSVYQDLLAKENQTCIESCSLEANYAVEFDYHDKDLVVPKPGVLCMNVGAKCRPGSVNLYLTWTTAVRTASNLVVFAVEMRSNEQKGDVPGPWTALEPIPSTFAKISGLSCSTLYQFRVTPVSKTGHLGKTKVSEWIMTYNAGASLQPPASFKVTGQSTQNQKPVITVEWKQRKNSSCNYKIFWFYEQTVEQVEIKTPYTSQYNLTDLEFNMNYNIIVHSTDDHFLKTSTDKLTTVAETPQCVYSLMFNHTVCRPLKPRNVNITVLTVQENSPDVNFIDILLHWEPPVGTHNGSDITRYFLTYRKLPPVHMAMSIRPDNAEKAIAPTTNSIVLNNIHNHNKYVFTLAAVSEGGQGQPFEFSYFFDVKESGSAITNDSSGNIGLRTYVNETGTIKDVGEMLPLSVPELVAIIIVPLVLLLAILLVVLKLMRRRIRLQTRYLSARQLGPVEEMNPIYEGMPLFSDPGGEKHVADSYEIDYSCLDFISVIGEGAFGKVVKAEFHQRPGDRGHKTGRIVAVKMLKEFYTGDESRNFVKEIQAMKNLGHHPYILSIIGCCLTGPKFCLVLDFCALGDLRNYLRKYREKLMCNVPSPYGMMSKAECGFQDNRGNRSSDTAESQEGLEELDITEAQLLSYARQITMGMEFLEQRKFIHRDLAARNVLLYDKRHVKISDFGLTRDVYETNMYQPTSARKLPYKWMAIESLFSQRFTIKSDVWSFGIVLWEIVTLGGSPYPSIPLKDLYGLLNEGYRMEKPENCSKQVYEIMLTCWHPNPNGRPSFGSLRMQIEKLLEQTNSYIDLSVEVSGDYFKESAANSQAECQSQETANNAKNTEINQADIIAYLETEKLIVDIHDEPKLHEQCLANGGTDLPKSKLEPGDSDKNSIDPGMYCLFKQHLGKNWSKSDRQLDKRGSSQSNRSLQTATVLENKHSFKQNIKSIFDKVGITQFVSTPKTRRRSVSLTDSKRSPVLDSERELRSSVTVL